MNVFPSETLSEQLLGNAVDPVSREVASDILGDKVTFVGGGRKDNMPDMIDNFGKHAEVKGIHTVEQSGYSASGVKQPSSHYSCPSCESVQTSKEVINITGVESKQGTQTRPLNPYIY